MRLLVAALALALALPGAASARAVPYPGFILARAVANYRALLNGTRQLADLDAIELREVREIEREVRAVRTDPRSSREQCIAEQTAARGGDLSDLAARIVDLACSQR